MEFSKKEEKAMEVAIEMVDNVVIQLTELQLLSVGGGVADVTLS